MIEIVCIRGSGDKEAPAINDPLITTIPVAVQRGRHFIDEEWYKVRMRTFRSPWIPNVNVCDVVEIIDGNLGIDDKHIVTSHSITIGKEGIKSTIRVERYDPLEEI